MSPKEQPRPSVWRRVGRALSAWLRSGPRCVGCDPPFGKPPAPRPERGADRDRSNADHSSEGSSR